MPRPLTAILLSLSTLALASCAGDFSPDRSRPVSNRALESPVETSDAEAEFLSPPQPGVPLVSVESSGTAGDHPTVRTIVDNVKDTLNPPAATPPVFTQPPTEPLPTIKVFNPVMAPTAAPPSAPSHVDPITGENGD